MNSDLEFNKNNFQNLINTSEEAKFNEVCALLKQDLLKALKVASSTFKSKKYLKNLLEQGLATANASEIEIWLKYLIPRLGFRSVINILEDKIVHQPRQVKNALYWLPKFLKNQNEKELNLLKNLEKKMLGEEYKVVSQSGKTYKLILRIKSTGEYAVFGGYQLGSHGSGVIAEILDSQNLYPTSGVKLVSPGDLEILNPQPYND
ncbi:hypothetical protein Sta7437_2999 [Stanieria cyanosphaera PCC 7437]|uniref:Uncharacterized protein n=1 Tax=Stanieria cyanosphaera (strain ATCC 29371 / PCC 7437) TaxID=111780 RepID=K9XVD9_STAC7|nr:hypothetical protein [Stanieria cyanosphaera]AFZ36518.1 hypothetical protein Sta7437_2999 [Stanieria cyanosphaera PCC 7437]